MKEKTKKQQEFYNSFLPKHHSVKLKIETKLIPEQKITDYMKNCIYWIEQYFEGNADYSKYWSATESLKNHIKECHKKATRF